MLNVELLEGLCAARGISGDEETVRDIILKEIDGFAEEITVDPLGNILVFKKGRHRSKNKLMLCAHTDEVGFMVTNITSDGFLKFECVGGIDKSVVYGKSVRVGKNGISGVVTVKPIHLCSSSEQKEIPDIDAMFIDIGADSYEQAAAVVALGDSVTFDLPASFSDDIIMSKAIDDRAGCYILCQMIRSEIEYDMYFAFNVQEEVGLRGAKTSAFTLDPNFAIVVESTTASDLPSVPNEKQVCCVGNGAVASFMDRSTIYDKQLYRLAFGLAEKNSIQLQCKRAVAGGNDSGAIHISRGGVRTLAISLPCRYLHSGVSLAAVSDIESAEKIIRILAEKICKNELEAV